MTKIALRTNRIHCVLFVSLLVGSFGLWPMAHAVSPPPDGGYQGNNTAEGQDALFSLGTGTVNTAIGFNALYRNRQGGANTAIGANALFNNTASQNTATGANALLYNTTGRENTANGNFALTSNTIGVFNTATGSSALSSNQTGDYNTANGAHALLANSTGSNNTATGFEALKDSKTGQRNTADGASALFVNDSGSENSATGYAALHANFSGSNNTATGAEALHANLAGSNNTADGHGALHNNFSGGNNTAAGSGALRNSLSGADNTAIGFQALVNNVHGSSNIALGRGAGSAISTASNVICIGVAGENLGNSCYIGHIFNQSSPSGVAVFVNSAGKLGAATSSARFKEDIKPMGKDSEVLLALKPVSFRYRKEIDPAGISQFGLVAEEVEKVNPDLIVRDEEGKPYSVRYDQVNAMLLNEFLKEHSTMQELRKEVAALTSRLKEQDLRMEKLSSRLEMSRSTPQMVANRR
jgi:hypothetical protein